MANAALAGAIRVSGPVSGSDKTLTFETGKLALQSQGAVTVSIGRSTVLATANAANGTRDGIDFFPSPSTSRSGPTRPARSPARSSAGRAVRARPRS